MKELNELREPLKEGLGSRILGLVDEHPALVFDVQKVFVGASAPYRDQAVNLLVEDVKKFSGAALDHHEQPLSVRFRILALVLNDPSSPLAAMPEAEATSLMDTLIGLLLSTPTHVENGHVTIPKWLASHLIVTEALLMMGEEPRSVGLPTKEDEPLPEIDALETGPKFNEKRPVISGATGPKCKLANGRTVTNLASYNYYNFLSSEALKEKAIQTLRTYGVGPCGPPGSAEADGCLASRP